MLYNMPKKKFNDQELKQKALELRKQGLSYREIAKKLNCSIFKIHEVLSEKRMDLENEILTIKYKIDFIMESELPEIRKRIEKIESELDSLKRKIKEEQEVRFV
jgi:orotate phosphoribosyltransferase-like protein